MLSPLTPKAKSLIFDILRGVKTRAVFLLFLASSFAFGQNSDPVHEYVAGHQREIVRQFSELLAMPNIASDTANIRKNAEYIAAQLQQRGVQARLLEENGGPPVVFGEITTPGAHRTVMIYAHYDGQKVDPTQWATPPWQPVVRDGPLEKGGEVVESLPQQIPGEWFIYARSAGDDKVPIMSVLTALDALKATGARPTVNLKFFFEGEEEAGSPHLAAAFGKYADLLKGDVWLLCDGPVHQTRLPQVFFGARGITEVEMTVYGPTRSLHSGHYGNWAPNPGVLISELIASMRDSNGNIKVAGFLDDMRRMTESETEAIAAMPDVDKQMKRELSLAWSEGAPLSLPLRITMPALNVRGIQVGHVGEQAQNAVPTEARASIDFRLVPDQRPERVQQLVEEHIRKQGFFVTHTAPTAEERMAHAKTIFLEWGPGYPPAKTSMDLPASKALVRTVAAATKKQVVQAPLLGGSIPMYLFVKAAPVIGLPVANHDDNQHAANENLRIQNLYDAIDIFAAVMTKLDGEWK
jgi:acetylornithine deacetylase/succinyl-diaminopimelate desuccinylase-like protein